MKKDILTLLDLRLEDCERLFPRALQLKRRHDKGVSESALAGRTLGLLFDKASTRTRLAFSAAMSKMGGTSLFIQSGETQMSRNEPLRDTARVMSRYLDMIAIRTYSQEWVERFAGYTDIPVINALTDSFHPTQVLSDLMTVVEKKGDFKGLKYAWVGDGNNMANSWINAAAVMGLDLFLSCPEGYTPDAGILETAKAAAVNPEGIRLVSDPREAVADADVVNTDVWAGMGQEEKLEGRKRIFAPYQLNAELMQHARADAIVLHCLPAHRGEEITDDVLEGPSSVVWDQAENKMHMAKAILEALIEG
ncbi:MAG: ornithine carbamoyltransferase [Desulfobacteraceae bacterium]|nr:ornithine carbamoyltransferase [Desulfobacteraceae bacterium]